MIGLSNAFHKGEGFPFLQRKTALLFFFTFLKHVTNWRVVRSIYQT